MMSSSSETRLFRVQPRDLDGKAVRVVDEASFEAAAVAYAEEFAHVGDGGDLKLVVQDLETGHEHCFLIDLDTGETGPCG